ncbi:MAG: YgeY family selenium metabolism-linked hydrolase [Chloroflexi bacterium]|nr:YgeY family selenium metabolism-linked hydrolase [Chloroflexota bacterium]
MIKKLEELAGQEREELIRFLRRLISLKSYSCHEEKVAEFVEKTMTAAGYDEVIVDQIGNVFGRIGTGKNRILYDAHMDTVGIGDPASWEFDPFQGKRKDGVIYGRGAVDMKSGLAAIVWAGRWIKMLGLEGDYTLVVAAVVQEEEGEGASIGEAHRQGFIPGMEDGRIDAVLLAEPSNLELKRGQRGRVEIRLSAQGRSCHGSMPEKGDNALYRLAPAIIKVKEMEDKKQLGFDPVLGHGSIAFTRCISSSGSLNTIPDSATGWIDRRLTLGETPGSAIEELEKKIGGGIKFEVEHTDQESYRGYHLKMPKAFRPWLLDEDSRLLRAGKKTYEQLFGREGTVSTWVFSTDGVYTSGAAGIPTLGFGPGVEKYAHTSDEQVEEEQLIRAAKFYAAFPMFYAG